MKTKTHKIVYSAMLAALVCVATMIIKIPSPLNGYLNLGDCFVLLCGWLLPPFYGFLAAGIGSALADIFLGYSTYAAATFVIKALMALCAFALYKALRKKTSDIPSLIISGAVAEIVMVLGYFIYEGAFLYGYIASVVNILPNAIQGCAGLVSGVVLCKIFTKNKIFSHTQS